MHRNPQEKGVILLSQTLHNLSINFNQNGFTKACIVSRLDGGGTSVHRLGMPLNMP